MDVLIRYLIYLIYESKQLVSCIVRICLVKSIGHIEHVQWCFRPKTTCHTLQCPQE
jgi:hypothetical protein